MTWHRVQGMGADAVSSTMTGDGCVSMDTSGDGSPCVVRSELEKASIAQVTGGTCAWVDGRVLEVGCGWQGQCGA